MKKCISFLGAILLVFGVAGLAGATLYTDVNTECFWFDSSNPEHTWIFDLDKDDLFLGDINPGDTINSAYLNILFTDNDVWEGWPLRQPKEFGNVLADGTVVWDEVELDILDSLVSINVLSCVQEDHVLNLTIQRVSGDFGVGGAMLSGCYTATPVPEAATMLLLGSGLVGLAVLRKRLKR